MVYHGAGSRDARYTWDARRPDRRHREDRRRAAVEDGKDVLRLAPVGGNRKGSNVGLALVAGVTCGEAAIDVDLRGQGEATASLVGIA